MIKNYLLTAFRSLLRYKGYSFINIAGLAIGMACSILIMVWVAHELSYDRFNEKLDRLYRLVQTQYYSSGPLTTTCMPGPIANIIAIPLAWYILKEWLTNYSYTTRLSADIFIYAFLLSILIAWITISFQAVKAALMNPVEAIRSE